MPHNEFVFCDKTIPSADPSGNPVTFCSSRALVRIDMSSAQINTDFSVAYPEGFDRGNCFVIGVSGFNTNYGVWYGYMNYENIKVILATNITVNTSDDAFVGEGAIIKVLLEKATIL